MREMKDSGVAWIGEIPAQWEVRKIASVVPVVTDFVASGSFADLRDNVKYLDTPDYAMLVRTADLSGTRDNTVYIDKHAYEYLSNSNLFGGEIILSNIGSVGNVFQYTPMYERSSLAPNAIMLNGTECNRYLYYWFLNPIANDELKRIGSHAVQLKFNKTQLKQMAIVYPPIEDQQKIAAHLDRKCTQIDALISNAQQQIEKLKAYKQSVITETVTKGLDPDVAMKDSGVEWIGEIPVNFSMMRMKNIGTCRNGLTYSPENLTDETGVLVLRSSNVQNGKLCFEDNVYVDCKIKDELMVKKGDILICSRNGSRALIGKSAIIDFDITASFGAFMMIFRSNYNPKYIYYILNSNIFSYYLGTYLTATINQLTGANFNSMVIPFCENDTIQAQIVSFLDHKCSQIDKLIALKQQKIEKLQQYKKSLIYEYVTGKKEV